jgi:hypothetical protein
MQPQAGPGKNVPAQNAGGRYKNLVRRSEGFVEAVPSCVLQGGTGTFATSPSRFPVLVFRPFLCGM